MLCLSLDLKWHPKSIAASIAFLLFFFCSEEIIFNKMQIPVLGLVLLEYQLN